MNKPQCSQSIGGLYIGAWSRESYAAAGNVTVKLEALDDKRIKATLEKMTGARYRLDDFAGPYTIDDGVITIKDARGDNTTINAQIRNVELKGSYRFKFGFLNLLTDQGNMELRKVDSL